LSKQKTFDRMNSILPFRETSIQAPFPSAFARFGPNRARHVLVLDDDTATRRLTALILARAGYSVDAAEDGELGWDALCAEHYNLLVTDHDMPRLKGLQLIERLRAVGLTLPVIIASGSIELGEVENYPFLALSAVLHKPFLFADLISAARRAAPIAPDAGEGTVHYRELHRSACSHAPSPARADSRPGVFAETA
jgi:CheY-like chemotaxis protein